MKYAYIAEDGALQDVIMSDPFMIFNHSYASMFVEVPDECHNGWTFDGKNFNPPVPSSPPIPQVVSRAQGKAALVEADLWDSVLQYVNTITDPKEKALAEIALNDTQEWQRTSPFLLAMAQALNLSDQQMDELFVKASKITF